MVRIQWVACAAILFVGIGGVTTFVNCQKEAPYRTYEKEHQLLRERYQAKKQEIIKDRNNKPATKESIQKYLEVENEYQNESKALRGRHGLPEVKPRDEDAKHVR